MYNVYAKIKESTFTWRLINFYLDCIARFCDGVIFLKKKIGALLRREFSSISHQHSLKAFIRYCQRQPSQPILFPSAYKDIDVSIIIPVYNQWKLTCACLNSILNTCDGNINYELILADDCSTDETINAAVLYPGLIVIRTDKNSGFLQNCNHAAQKARGRYLLLLNNDTIVLPNWLESLYQTIEGEERIAIVGSKILCPTGKIQEAGSIIFQNGNTLNIGYGCHRRVSFLNTRRDVDYISGCSVLIRKSFWDSVEGFDPRYKNAYYEDTDLAMNAHAQGMRVVYQPSSEVIHFLHKTYGHTHQDLLETNKKLFLEKWNHALKSYSKFGTSWHVAMVRAEQIPPIEAHHRRKTNSLNILYYSPIPTYPANHGNRARICNLIKKFERMGHKVHFVMLENSECTKDGLQAMENQFTTVDIIPCKKKMVSFGVVPYDGWYKDGIGEHIYFLCKRYDIDLILCSYIYQSKLLEFVPNYILKVIDTHDKMGNRSEMLRLNKLPLGHFSCTPEEEGAYVRRADLVVGITDEEARYFETVSGQKNTIVISHSTSPKFLNNKFSTLGNVGIVASNNQFNLAVVQKFLERIDCYLQKEEDLPFIIHVAGEVKKAAAKRIFDSKMNVFKKSWVRMHGYVPNIAEFYGQMDLIVSPMLCGTGINIKTVEAMAHGMPLLTTVHGSRGAGLDDKMHNHKDIDSLVHSLFFISKNPTTELQRLADLSREKYVQFHEKNEAHCKLLFEHPRLKIIK
ncbi:putative glycosyl transferase [Legionella gratiana]|uniref:Glycosyl transferase n=1 Tax=Legionella gratiana TaxID=45066 RepID=A0A378JNG9_9GAMM|nr:glycosyltransferase [Legionella gratiana]KTD12086.1 putative glycosyl transferase [Legionella gratiana]STX46310.1 putative glycosyl transferase [Legionella gratiana]